MYQFEWQLIYRHLQVYEKITEKQSEIQHSDPEKLNTIFVKKILNY